MNQKTFKTPKGTLLPITDLRGKDYLEVKHRITWFREEKPNWSIQTDYIQFTENSALAKASVYDEQGILKATAHKYEDRKGFPDFLEKAETGSVGRALSFLGYGTQHAPELEEGERIVDSPVVRSQANSAASSAPQEETRGPAKEFPFSQYEKDGPWGKEKCTVPQVKRLYALAKAAGYDHAALKGTVETLFKKTRCEDLTKSEIQKLFGEFESDSGSKTASSNPSGPKAAAKQPQPART